MRNIKLQYVIRVPPSTSLEGSHDICVDPDTGRIILVTATNALVLDPVSAQVVYNQSLISDAALPADGSGQVVGVHYLPDQSGACLATSNGNLALWTLDLKELECVGCVESGLTAMAWSPDQELLVLTTGAETVILMTREFDPVTEMPIHSEEFGEGELMTVGWGKKETQFHGSEGKQAAQKQTESVQQALSWDDRHPRIRWRGDGQFFAISSINPAKGPRYIRVWSREGVLQSTSEPMNNLEQALFWKPSGALIASTQRKPNKHDVVFFEKNGLPHGEFTLPFGVKDVKVVELMWNMDSTILALWCQDLPTEESSESHSNVLLWTCSNYHWSLKQFLTFGGHHGNVTAVTWDPEHAGCLHVVTSVGQYLQYTWTWVTNHSLGQASCDPANVFVIDGNTVGVTPLRKMVVPPPMSAYKLLLPSPAVQVVSPASPPAATANMAVLTQDNQLLVFHNNTQGTTINKAVKLDAAGGNGFSVQCTTPLLHATYRLDLPAGVSGFPLCITHVCWPQADILVFCFHGDNGIFLCTGHFPSEGNQNLKFGSLVMVEDSVISLSVNPQAASSVAVQLVTGTVLRFSLEDESLLPWETASGEELRFPVACPQMEVTTFSGEEAVLGLTDRFRFYVNGTEVASNCTSFTVHDEFLLLTTLNHTVRCIHRHTPAKDLPSLSDGKAHPFDECIRRMERGSRIVAVVAEDTKLVLQMPRGNLEAVHPRALVLATVRRLLDKCEFGSAFTIMKKHRINLNLLYDHNPNVFLQHLADFIQQVSSVTDINLFLTELQEDDVTVTMYTAAYKRTIAATASTDGLSSHNKGPSKVDTVCDAIRCTLELQDADRYRLAVLTTYVKKTTPELEKALEMVWQLKLKESAETKGMVGAEEALKFLLFLVDVNQLYNAALATYNFDLVLMVAEKSQKDPKEYIPFLNQLRRLEENYCKFTIDKHLKHYSSALKHIALCGADHFSECVDLVQDHKLYTEALKLFPTDSLEFKTLVREYGHYLREKNRHDEAGVAFMRAEYWQLAFDSFVTALNWRQAVCMAARLQFDPAHMADVARKMAVRLKDSKQFCEAAVLFEQHAKDVEEAIVTLIGGAQWEEALRLMYTYQRTDFIETHLKDAINDACHETMTTLETQQTEMEQHVDRLTVVRQEKERRHQQLWASGDHHDTNADLFSDTSSATGESIQSSKYTVDSNRSTVFSKTSGRSNRNRRKADHKKWSLKEGSPYEDCALIDAIAKIIKAVDGMRDEISALLRLLVQFHQVAPAEQLQAQYDGFLSTVQAIIPRVWLQEDASDTSTVLGPGMTTNTIVQAMQRGQANDTNSKSDPVLQVAPVLKKDVRWKLHMLQTAEK